MGEAGDNEAWQRYGAAVIEAMREVLEEADDDRHRELLLETADYWLGLGLAIGLHRPDRARTLLGVIHADAAERAEMLADADDMLARAV